MAEIKGKIHVIADRDLNNKAIYKVLHPETESSQITDFATATDNRIDDKITDFYNNTIVGSYLPIDGNAPTASNLSISRDITISDASKTNTGVATSFNGGSNINLRLPSTIKADLTGNADTATILKNSKDVVISDSNGTHSGITNSFNGSSNLNLKLPSTITAELDGNATTATTLKNSRDINISDNDNTNSGPASNFNGSENITLALPSTIKATLTGNASTATKLANKKTIAISGAATGTATEFDGTLDISIPVTTLDASKLSGTASVDTTGNAATATTLKNSRTLKISDADATNTGAGTTFNGSQAITIALPGTIKAELTGNASTASKLANKKIINIQDADGTNTGTGINFDGSDNDIIKLPSTIKADLTGNASTATNATNDSAGNQITTTYAPLASPELIGTPTAPTAALGTKTTQVATTAFVDNAIKNLIGAAPAELDTLKEIADAINNDQDVYNTLNNAITTKQSAHAALTSISELTTSADKMIYTTAANTYATTPLTSLARNLLDDTTASAMRITIDALGKSEKATAAIAAEVAEECTGNAVTATTLKTGRNINVSDADGTHTGTAFNFNGSSAGTIKLPSTIKATLEGNADTATKLYTKRSINIQDSSGTNTGTEIKFDGSNTSTLYLKLPATIKANLDGNASTATAAAKATNDSDDKPINTTYVKKSEGVVDLTLSNQTLTFKRGDNTTATLTTKDEKLQQNVSTTNSAYPLLASAVVNGSTNTTTTAIFSKDVKINPNTKSVIASKFVGDLEGTADAAIEDSAGNNISTTYETKVNAITGLAISGQTITYTKGNGTTGTITTSDTNTFVTQSVSTVNSTYPILASSTPNATTDQGAKAAIFGKAIKINPSTGTLYATTFSGSLSGNATSATNATNDSGGHQIDTTYETKANAITGLSISGKTITYTKGNSTTGTITTQDQNVSQTAISTINSAYPVLFKNSTAVTDTTSGTYFNSVITINPSTGTITAKNFNGLAAKATNDSLGNQINTTYAPLASPELTGTPTAPTAATSTNNTQIATTAFAKAAAAAANTDAKVAQNVSTVNSTYPVLIAATANATSNIAANAAQFGKDIKINPSIGELIATKVTATTFTGSLSGAATSATKDSENQNIADTYIKGLTVSGKTITYTKGDGDTGTITTQDTTYTAASDSNLGLVKIGSNITNSSGTISLTKDNVTSALGYTPPTTDTNTHYTTHLVAASTNALTTNTVAANGNVYLNVIDDSTVRNAINIKGTGSTTVTASNGIITINSTGTEYEATTSIAGLMSAADKAKLDGITADADAVSFSQTKTSGTEVGKITINGTTTTLYGDTNTDAKVEQTASTTTNAIYPILLSATANRTTTATEGARFGANVKVNPSSATIYATTFSGNATSATKATNDSDNNQINTTYAKLSGANFTGTVTASTAALGTKTTQVATTEFVDNAINNLIGAAPGTLDTLEEIADAINNDQDVYNTLNNAITTKQSAHAALTSISELTTSADKMIYTTAANTYATTPLTATARTLLDDADVAAMRTTLSVPSRTGGDASGTWGINISGTAATATNDSNGKKISEHTIEYIVGTQTAATGAWTGVTKDAALYAGKIIVYKLPVAGSGNATLNLTLSGGGTTGAKAVYRYASTRLTTQYAANYYVPLIYNGTYWFAFADYDTNYYDHLRVANAFAVASGDIATYKFVGSTDGNAYKQLDAGDTFDIRYPILYNVTAYADAAAMSTGLYWIYCGANLQTTLGDTTRTFTEKMPLYLKGTLSGNIFTVHSDILTTTVPASADGYYYIYVGRTYSTYQANINVMYNQIWCYSNGAFQSFNPAAIKAIQDIKGQQIDSTYIKGLSVSGKTITYTKGDSSTGTITTQDTDTHHTAYIRAGASSGTANASTTNGNTYINLVENSTFRSGVKITGSGATSVTSDASGNITISSTDNNTTYSAATSSNLGLVTIGSNISVSSGTISLTASNVTTALGTTAVSRAAADASGNTITSTYMTKYTYASAVTIATGTTTDSTTAGAWYTTATTVNNISYARRYQINVTNLTANDVVEVEITGNTNIARAAGLAAFTISASGCFYLYAKETPSSTFTIRYRVYKA